VTHDVLATDYDGTLADAGHVSGSTIAALELARESGIRPVLVTGRELADLFNVFDRPELFELIVAENGAVLFDPASGQLDPLAVPAPPPLVDRLTRAAVPLSVGHTIVATVQPYEALVLEAIRELGLDWHVIFNKGAVMASPAAVTKAPGLARALEKMGVPAARTVGIGDAENDQAFLRACGLAVAVANALPTVKATAHLVTAGAAGDGVTELITEWIADRLPARAGHRADAAGPV
jgi:hydroxymethylpyrimidine pyrophosphatase-like HAD family hydrolase